MEINLPSSKPQANVVTFLDQFRKLFLQEALASAIRAVDLSLLNSELAQFVPERHLKTLAAAGVRGEFFFSVPAIICTKPNLLGYYRLLLGYSQKEFYQKSKLGRFECLETNGTLPSRLASQIEPLCKALIERAAELLEAIPNEKLSAVLLHELTLLTLGPQLRGSNNTRIGRIADRAIFEIIQQIVAKSLTSASTTRLEIVYALQRRLAISFSSDPDVSITEDLGQGRTRQIVAIEVKGGTDKSNIWNRLGEAEKSHHTAKTRGFEGFWTIYNVDNLDLKKARQKSPTTQRFYNLIELASSESADFIDFRDRVCSMLGIPRT